MRTRRSPRLIAVRCVFFLERIRGWSLADGADEQTTNLLVERLRAWKHMCVYLEDYVSATAKIQKSQSKDYEKVLKVCFCFLYEKEV